MNGADIQTAPFPGTHLDSPAPGVPSTAVGRSTELAALSSPGACGRGERGTATGRWWPTGVCGGCGWCTTGCGQAPTVPFQKSAISGNYRKLQAIFLLLVGGLLSQLSLGFKPLVIFKACTAKQMQAEKQKEGIHHKPLSLVDVWVW